MNMSQRSVQTGIREICEKALRRATPSAKEKEETVQFSKKLAAKLQKELKKAGLKAEAHIEGSIAKDTWLSDEKDIDLFVLLPKDLGREAFTKVLDVAKRVAGKSFLEAYAEHPYIEAEVKGFTVDFVPCFKVESAGQVESSVDRTPFHTQYVKSHLTEEAKKEVRLLKRFMRGIDTYGAEIKVGGFSGYLCEVLILFYGSFLKLLEAAVDWKENEIIDLENHFKDQDAEARQIFPEPLIVVDPVDKGRNVASAARPEKLNEFIAASRQFLKAPSLGFFYSEPFEPLTFDEIARTMSLKGTTLVLLKTEVIKAVPDVLWGQLYRSQKALAKMVSAHGFNIIHDAVWSDEKTANIFLFELGSRSLPAVERHVGPPIRKKEDCERFLAKYAKSEVLSGPIIEGDRWIVDRLRKYTDIVELIQEKLRNGGENLGMASLVSEAFLSSFDVWVNSEVKSFYLRNHDFGAFLTKFLVGKPRWLR
jgi:tRNA nucleotidyltransferase (CCA-adding enzyme)